MTDDDKALLRLHTMSDWQEFSGFNSDKILEELKPFDNDWKRYNPKKPNNRWGLSVTSMDGGLSGIPDLTSLLDYELQTGIVLKNSDLDTPTPVWTQSIELKKLLEPWRKWITRCHFLRMDRGSFFPDHFDVNKEDFSYDEIRLVGFINCNEYNFKWIYDDKIFKGRPGSLWYFNANKRHCVFSTEYGVMLLVVCLKWDKDLFLHMLSSGHVR
jgi:hypothetical protein